MGEHVAEPWSFRPAEYELDGLDNPEPIMISAAEPLGPDGKSVFTEDMDDYCGLSDATARRIVACVNALAGIETEDLEKGGEGWIFPIVEDFVQDTTTASENVKRMYDCATTNKARADAAEALLRDAVTVLDSPEMAQLWGECLHLLGGYSGPTIDVDAIRAFLAETAPKPVRLGDEGEG